MKRSNLLAGLFIFSTTAYSQHFDPGVIRLLDAKQYPAPQVVSCNLLGDTSESKKAMGRDLNDCAMALCDLPSKNPNVFVTNTNLKNYITPEIASQLSREVNPRLDLALKRIKKDRAEQLKNIEKKLLSNGAVKINMQDMDPVFNSSLSEEVLGRYVKKEIDMKRPVKERVKITVAAPENASPEFKAQLNKYAQDYEKFNKYSSAMVSEFASEKEESVIAKEYYALVKKAYMDSKKSIPANMRKEIEDQIKQFDKQGPASLYDVSELELRLSNSGTGYKSVSNPPTCNDVIACQKIFENYLTNEKNVSNTLASINKDLNNPETLKQEKLKCTAGIVTALSNSSDSIKAKNIFVKVKKQMEDKVFSRFSAHSRGVLKKYFDKGIDVNTTNQPTDTDVSENSLRELDTAGSANLTIQIQTQEDAYNELMKMQDDGVYNVGIGLCQNGQSTAWDAFLPFKNFEEDENLRSTYGEMDQMFVSPFTTMNEKTGKAFVAHELGHAMSYAFQDADMSKSSAATYNKLRQCATGNYLNNKGREEGQNTEEDTADLVAYMTYENEKEVLLCSILQPASDNRSYVNLGFIEENTHDVHSTSLYRAYLEAVNKGITIPVSCQKAFAPYSQALSSKKCI